MSLLSSRVNSNHRWMMFVDGENLSIRAQAVAKAEGRVIGDGLLHMHDTFIWIADQNPTIRSGVGGNRLQLASRSIRSFYYTAVQGDDQKRADVEQALWSIGFTPVVFKKLAGQKSKGVDIRLTIDLLTNAFNGNYDLCILYAGDKDYVPIVKEVQRYGKVVSVCFFDHPEGGLSPELKIAGDEFFDLKRTFLDKCPQTSGSAR
jgi:uncharacterized LabA/DUF88 family protein